MSGVMSCWQGKAHERRDAEPDKARHIESKLKQRDTLRQRKSGVMLRQSNEQER